MDNLAQQSPAQQSNIPNQQGSLGSDPNFLRYLQGFLAKPINAGLIQKKRISSVPPNDGQALVFSTVKNMWQPGTPGVSASGTITYVKTINFGTSSFTTGSIVVSNGLITSFT